MQLIAHRTKSLHHISMQSTDVACNKKQMNYKQMCGNLELQVMKYIQITQLMQHNYSPGGHILITAFVCQGRLPKAFVVYLNNIYTDLKEEFQVWIFLHMHIPYLWDDGRV